MLPPIAIGSTLQNRYRVLNILGQGGFGRTYLAADQGRFDELCAVKELIPSEDNAYAMQKSRELFQREAATLYQIQHPQIPQFQASFEQDQRLFLVQDYVAGKTYRTLLNERKSLQPYGQPFTEAEVLLLLQQILPLLEYLHGRGIIHRDISPDNIILRDRDRLPVLIDFGVVKEIATRIQANANERATTVGKIGYAPVEQLQSGQAYPSSDLYALAVTAIVLLSGREPQELFDDRTVTWQWQHWANVSPLLAQVLNRMLSYKPGERFQSATQVIQALQGGNAAYGTLASPPAHAAPTYPSQVATVAIGRPVENYGQTTVAPTASTASPASDSGGNWGVVVIGCCLTAIAGVAAWAVTGFLNSRPQPTPSPVTTLTSSPSPTVALSPTASPSPATPIAFSQRVTLALGEQKQIEGNLKANQVFSYLITAQQGQQLKVAVSGQNVLMSVIGPNQDVVADTAKDTRSWQGVLPFNGDYAVQLTLLPGVPQANFRVNLNLNSPIVASPTASPAPSPTASPSPSPTVSLSPDPSPSPIEPGKTSTPILQLPPEIISPAPDGNQVAGQAIAGVPRIYRIPVLQGQSLEVEVTSGDVKFDLRLPNGQLVDDIANVRRVRLGVVPVPGDYQIDVMAPQDTNFTLTIIVR